MEKQIFDKILDDLNYGLSMYDSNHNECVKALWADLKEYSKTSKKSETKDLLVIAYLLGQAYALSDT